MERDKTVAVLPGSFDPVTFGHYDIISKAIRMFDKLYVAVLHNPDKKTLFDIDERVLILQRVLNPRWKTRNIVVCPFQGMLVDFCKYVGATHVARGIRDVTDFSYEMTMYQTNHILEPDISTVFIPTSPSMAGISSSAVRTVAKLGSYAQLLKLVPAEVVPYIKEKMNGK